MSKRAKLLFVIQDGTAVSYPSVPVGLYRLKSFLNKSGYEADILDFSIDRDIDGYLRRIEAGEYNLVGFSMTYFNIKDELPFFWKVRDLVDRSRKSTLLMAGGQQATINYEFYLDNGFDGVFLGYSEKIILEFLKKYEQMPSDSVDKFMNGMNGVAFKSEGKIVFNPFPLLTEEEFDYYSHDLMMETEFPYDRYWENIREKLSAQKFNNIDFDIKTCRLYTSALCPMGCGFCSAQSFLPAALGTSCPVFRISAEKVFEQIIHCVETYGAEAIFFNDDNFVGQDRDAEDRIITLCEMILKAKEDGRLPSELVLHGLTRIDNFIRKGVTKNSLLKLMKKAGFKVLVFGVETFSERLLRAPSVNKRNTCAEDITQVIDAVLEEDLCPQVSIIMGIPETTVDEMLYSMKISAEFLVKGALVSANSVLMSMPGAPIHTMDEYPKQYMRIENQFTGNSFELPDFCLPFDETVRDLMTKLDEIYKNELEEIRKDSPWKEGVVPKFFSSLAFFIGISKYLKRKDYQGYFEKILKDTLESDEELKEAK